MNSTDWQLICDTLNDEADTDPKAIAEAVMGLALTLIRKNTDYGSSVFKVPRLAPDADPGLAIAVRFGDKLERLEHLLSVNGKCMVVDEGIDDTLLDIAGYSILWRLFRARHRKEQARLASTQTPDTVPLDQGVLIRPIFQTNTHSCNTNSPESPSGECGR